MCCNMHRNLSYCFILEAPRQFLHISWHSLLPELRVEAFFSSFFALFFSYPPIISREATVMRYFLNFHPIYLPTSFPFIILHSMGEFLDFISGAKLAFYCLGDQQHDTVAMLAFFMSVLLLSSSEVK